jgi:hypothetical protein
VYFFNHAFKNLRQKNKCVFNPILGQGSILNIEAEESTRENYFISSALAKIAVSVWKRSNLNS